MKRARAFARALSVAVGAVLTFVVAVVAAVFLHMDLPCARRVAVAQVDVLLQPVLQGKIEVRGIERLRLSGVDGVEVRIVDPEGVTVILAQGVSARISVWGIVRSALFGKEDIDVALSRVSVDHVDVNLDIASDGVLRILHAIEPKSGPKSGTPPRGVRIALPKVEVTHSWIHGPVAGTPVIDLETVALRGGLLFQNKQVSIDVAHVALQARGLPNGLNPVGEIEAHLRVPSKTGKDIGLEAGFTGVLGAVPITLSGSIDGRLVDGSVDLPTVSAETLRGLWPEAPLFESVGVHLEGHGELPSVVVTAEATLGHGTVDAVAQLELVDDAPSGIVRVHADRIDARAFSTKAPRSQLGFVLGAGFAGKPGKPVHGELSLEVTPGTVGAEVVPHATFAGDFTVDPKALGGDKTLRAQGTIEEAGAPINVSLDLRPSAGPTAKGEVVVFAVTSQVPSLAGVRRLKLPAALGGHGSVAAKGTVRLPSGTLDATVNAEADGLALGESSVETVKVSGHASGTLQAPSLESTVTVDGARQGEISFSHAELSTKGPLLDQAISFLARGSRADLDMHADLDTHGRPTLNGLTVSAKHDGIALVVHADSVSGSAGQLVAKNVTAEGLGSAVTGEVRLTPDALLLTASTKGVELDRLSRLAGYSTLLHGGKAAFDVDVQVHGKNAVCKFLVDVSHAAVPDFDDVSAHVDARMDGRTITGTAHVAVDQIGTFDVKDSVVQVGGKGPLDLKSWRQAWGQLAVSGLVDLAKLAANPAIGHALPFSEMAGQVYFEGLTARDSATDYTPELVLSGRTHGLVLAQRGAWRTEGTDFQIDSKIDGESGFAELAVRAADKDGVLVGLDAKSDALPYVALIDGTEPVLTLLKETGFVATIVVPRRSLARLPEALRKKKIDATGDLEATINVTGSAEAPHVDVVARAYDLLAGGASHTAALGLDILAAYDGQKANVTFKGRAGGAQVLDGDASVVAPVDALLRGDFEAWYASAALRLTDFPLAAVPEKEHTVRGNVSGVVSIDKLHWDATAKAKLELGGLQVGSEKYAGLSVDVTTDAHSLVASTSLGAPGKDGANDGTTARTGTMEAKAKAGLHWGADVAPSLDAAEPVVVSFKANHFRVGSLRPFTSATLSELDGTVDGDASITLDPKTSQATMKGTVTLDDGVIQLASSGQEFHKAHAKLTLAPGGMVRLEDISALGLSGKLMGSGVARMRGLGLAEARLDLRIPKGQAIPLDVQGAEMGEVDGDVSIALTAGQKIAVNVTIPTLHVQLPIANTHQVESLDPPDSVSVGTRRGKETLALALAKPIEEAAEPAQAPTEIDVAIHLGSDVTVKRGTQLRAELGGDPSLKITGETRMSGQVILKAGTLDVQGKRFEIEKGGTVSFVGSDPSNPEAVVTASWTAPDGTRVYADFIGPLKTGKVKLRSEPVLPDNEIVALILFGTSDGASSTASTQSTTASAGAAATAEATQGLSQGLDQLTGLDVSARVDTTDAANPRPELEVQIARDISAQIAFVIGTPAPGQNTDRTFLTLDWRFFRNWSLETTFGDAGSSMADVIWQYRY